MHSIEARCFSTKTQNFIFTKDQIIFRRPQVLFFIEKKNSHLRNRSYIVPLKEESDHSQTFHAWKVQLFSLTAQEKISLLFLGFYFITDGMYEKIW